MYLTTIPNTIDRMFNDFFTEDFQAQTGSECGWLCSKQPKMDIHKTKNEYQLTLELPGYEQKDISVNVENNNLRISGEIKKEGKSDTKTIHKEIYRNRRKNTSL